MVGGSDSVTRMPDCKLSYGSRVDVHSWSKDVATTGPKGDLFSDGNNNSYTDSFNGTSSATGIVGGVVASLQGVAKANGITLTSMEMRDLLSSTGTPQEVGPHGELIGPQPDFAAAIQALLGP